MGNIPQIFQIAAFGVQMPLNGIFMEYSSLPRWGAGPTRPSGGKEWNIPRIFHMEYSMHIPCHLFHAKVDMKCLQPGYLSKGKLQRHPVEVGRDCNGNMLHMELVNPAIAIAALFFHPCNFPTVHMRAEAEYGTEQDVDAWLKEHGFRATAVDWGVHTATQMLRLADTAEGQDRLEDGAPDEWRAILSLLEVPECTLRHGLPRVYGHPFTCDKAIAAQAVVDAKPVVEGETNVLVQENVGSDSTDTSQVEKEWPQHLKVTNVAVAQWFRRHSKMWLSSMATLTWNPAKNATGNAQDRHDLYQRQMALLLVCLEELARNGIHCTHKSPPPYPMHVLPSEHDRNICGTFLWE